LECVQKRRNEKTKALATTVYLYPSEIQKIEVNAADLGLSKSSWIRRAILKAFKEALN